MPSAQLDLDDLQKKAADEPNQHNRLLFYNRRVCQYFADILGRVKNPTAEITQAAKDARELVTKSPQIAKVLGGTEEKEQPNPAGGK